MPSTTRGRLLTAAVGCALGLSLAPSSAAVAAAPSPPYDSGSAPGAIGVKFNPDDYPADQAEMFLSRAREANVRHVIVPAAWWALCPTSERCDYSRLKRGVSSVRAHGMTVTVQLFGTPDWVHPDLSWQPLDARRWRMPRDDAERRSFTAFSRGAAEALKGQVQRYEIWNEPDLSSFSGGSPSPQEFARTVAAGYTGVKAADPQAIVASGGLSRAAVDFARRTLNTLDSLPGAQQNNGYLDEFGVHPYADSASPVASFANKAFVTRDGFVDFNFTGYRRIEAVLDERGRRSTKIWLGEVGYSTTDTWMKAVPDWRRAGYLMQASSIVASDPRVSGLVWYGLAPGTGIGPEWSLLDWQGRSSQTFDALRSVNSTGAEVPVRASQECSEARLSTGWGDVSYSGDCVPSLAGRVLRSETYVDGNLVRTTEGANVVVDGGTRTRPGAHELSVVFYGPHGPLGVTRKTEFFRQG